MQSRGLIRLVAWSLCAALVIPLRADEQAFQASVAPLVKQFCVDCHAGQEAEAGLNLEKMVAESSLTATFKNWQKVAAMLQQGKMPPKDALQLSEAQRHQLAGLVREELRRVIRLHADDPGPTVIRRLTSAEYAYTIQDLTGLDLKLDRDFVSDAVGGEGFTNAGSAQFIQDSTLQRYLEAAKKVAAHAVIGAGELQFFHDPGKTGLELSAINRILDIYRKHGFRTAAGEGAVPFGLDRYPKAFHAAWRYRHRGTLGFSHATLASLAAEEGLTPAFVEHVWSVLNADGAIFPTSEIVSRWRNLPVPTKPDAELERQVRKETEALYQLLLDWQTRLARAVGDEEEAAVLSETSFQVAKSHAFVARFIWPEGTKLARIQFSVVSADPGREIKPVVVWRNPKIRFRRSFRRREEPQPLTSVLSSDDTKAFAFGRHPLGGSVEAADFVTTGTESRGFELTVPEGARGAELTVEAQLDLAHGEDCVVRCEILGHDDMAEVRTVAATLLANADGAAFQAWKAGVLQFARLLPQVSHREPAPSDRDPIPPPFDNTYNARERDYFHYKVKYHRDDQFLVEKMLNAEARRQLDNAWADLLGSFEYHDAFLRFVADKYTLNLGNKSIRDLDAEAIERLTEEPRQFVKHLRENYDAVQRAQASSQPRHIDDVLALASRAWRRQLADEEKRRLRSYYGELLTNDGLDHRAAIRALVVRVLVAPDFLYRAERPAGGSEAIALADWELASRLSYFLWSSLPDEELSRAAAAGQLRDPEQLARQARRMLADAKARRLATEFFGQWFGFYQFDRHRGVDVERFPEFNDRLKSAMYDEAVSFFEHIVRTDRPVNEILFADYAFLNRDLAKHYAVAGDQAGDALAKVEGIARDHRGGLLGLGAVLTVTSAPLRTSAVKRGDWILRRVLGTAVPPPPADAGSIPADDVLADGLTMRQRLEAHRRNATCANCHSRIDALGFALEHYDSLGRWRDEYRDGKPIEDLGTLTDGTVVSGPGGLRQYLTGQQSQFHRTLCTKLLGYCLGRGEQICDQALIEDMVASLASGEGRFSEIVEKIVTSRQFRYHRAE
jgi:hypothetical protein